MNDDISANTRQTSPDTTCTGSMGVCVCARARIRPINTPRSEYRFLPRFTICS